MCVCLCSCVCVVHNVSFKHMSRIWCLCVCVCVSLCACVCVVCMCVFLSRSLFVSQAHFKKMRASRTNCLKTEGRRKPCRFFSHTRMLSRSPSLSFAQALPLSFSVSFSHTYTNTHTLVHARRSSLFCKWVEQIRLFHCDD